MTLELVGVNPEEAEQRQRLVAATELLQEFLCEVFDRLRKGMPSMPFLSDAEISSLDQLCAMVRNFTKSEARRRRSEITRLIAAGKQERELVVAIAQRFPDLTSAELSAALQDATVEAERRGAHEALRPIGRGRDQVEETEARSLGVSPSP